MRRPIPVSIATLVLTFGIAEIALRVARFENPPAGAPMLVWNPTEDELMSNGKYLYRFDEDSLWSPRPGATIQFGELEHIDGPPEPVNADGFRGPRIPRLRTPGVLRVAALGDSSTFGLAMRQEQTWCAKLALRLAELGAPAEVLNAGVEGFTIAQGLEHYRHEVRPYHPDVVIAAFGAINEQFPETESDSAKIAHGRDSRRFVVRTRRWLRDNVRVVQGVAALVDPGASERFLQAAEQRRRELEFMIPYQNDPAWPFGRRVEPVEFQALLGTLADEVERDGGRLILVIAPRRADAEAQFPVLLRYSRATGVVAYERDIQVLAAHSRFRKAHADGEPDPPLFIHDWWHPSTHGHEQLAAWLAPMVLDPERNRGSDDGL